MSPAPEVLDDKSANDSLQTSSADNSAGDTQVQEASADPAQDHQPGDDADAASTGEEGNAAQPDAGADGPDPSLTTPTPSKTKAPDWQQRYKHLEPHLSRTQQENKRLQNELRQFEGIDHNAIRQWQAQQQHAQRANLPQWNPQHPDNASFKSLQERWQFANQTLGKSQQSPAFEEIRQSLLSGFTPAEQQQMAAWNRHQQGEVARLASNPEALKEVARAEAAQVFQQEYQRMQEQQQQRQQAEQHVDSWFKSPANKPVIANYGQQMAEALQQGVPWHIVQRDAENAYLRSQLGTGKQTVAAAEEQRRLAKGNASITRDPATRPMADLFEEAKKLAKERGVRPGTPQFMPILHEVEARHRADAPNDT